MLQLGRRDYYTCRDVSNNELKFIVKEKRTKSREETNHRAWEEDKNKTKLCMLQMYLQCRYSL